MQEIAMARIVASALGLLLFSLTVVAHKPGKHTKDSLDTVKKNLKAGKAVLLDVREQEEWDEGHLSASRLVPQSKLKMETSLDELLKTLPKDKIVYTHCHAGRRALA